MHVLMLSISSFKSYQISFLDSIKGGIACSEIIDVIEYLVNSDDPNENAQANVVAAMAANGQIQCT